jgi:hypothetical protein
MFKIFVGREFLAVGNFCRGFCLTEVFGGFWDFWRLGIFGVFVINGQNDLKFTKIEKSDYSLQPCSQ